MLVLSRQAGDGVEFPDLELSFEILKIHSSRVQVGVRAPKSVRILRSELVEASGSGLLSHVHRCDANSVQSRLRAAMEQLQLADRHLQLGKTELAELAMHHASEHLRCDSESAAVQQPWRAIGSASSNAERVSESPVAYGVAKSSNEGLAV
jgi:carbon storage regulator CsrA